jgi:hypothetical protein
MARTVSERLRRDLVADLRARRAIGSDRVAAAFLAVAREHFLPHVLAEDGLKAVYRDDAIVTKRDPQGRPLSSSSQPALMAKMLELLDLQAGHRVLEIGAGTGYNSFSAELGWLALLDAMADPTLDTASQRSATGLDPAARKLSLQIVDQAPSAILSVFFIDRFAGYADYYAAVSEVWGADRARSCERAVSTAAAEVSNPLVVSTRDAARERETRARALLEHMPEPDFRTAVADTLRIEPKPGAAARITELCRRRGAPWAFREGHGFEWVGDEEIERTAVLPALSAVSDPRFAGGVKSDFESARAELALGTPKALSQSVHQSGCAIESAMKVVLNERQIAYDAKDTAQRLFEHLVQNGIVTRDMERLVLGAATPRNKKGGHGAGATPHQVAPEDAEAVLGSAAVAIAYG